MVARSIGQLFLDYMKVWETGNLADLDALLSDDYVGHPSQGDRDLDGLRERIAAFHAAYAKVAFRIDDQLAEKDKVATRLTATARRASDGQDVVLYGLNISRVAEGRIVEEWMAWEVQPARPV